MIYKSRCKDQGSEMRNSFPYLNCWYQGDMIS